MLFNKYDPVAIHPLKYLLAFLIFTEVLFFVGPIDYKIANPPLMIFYFAILNFALYFGYVRGMKKFSVSTCNINLTSIKILLVLGLILQIEYLLRKWASHGLSLSTETLMMSLADPGAAYKGNAEVSVNVITGIIFTPFRWAAIPIGIFAWSRLNKTFKGIVLLTVFIAAVTWLGIGTRKGLMDLILIMYFLVIAAYPKLLREATKRRLLKFFTLMMIFVFVLFFLFSNISRSGKSDIEALKDLTKRDYKPFYTENFSPVALAGMGEVTGYLCHGYDALSISMSEIGVITPTIGGSSMATWLYLDRFLGYNPMPDTYMAILEKEYQIDMFMNWHSIYLWLANDFTFFGVPFIIFLIGYFFGGVWMDCLSRKNVFAYPVCALMVIMVFYFFANNQVLSFSFEIFVFSLIIYAISRARRNYVQ